MHRRQVQCRVMRIQYFLVHCFGWLVAAGKIIGILPGHCITLVEYKLEGVFEVGCCEMRAALSREGSFRFA